MIVRKRKVRDLKKRPLFTEEQSAGLEAIFKILASETRLRILQALMRAEESRVTDLSRALRMKPQAVSNQLQRMARMGLLASRRDGNSVYYQLNHGCVPQILELAVCLMENGCDEK